MIVFVHCAHETLRREHHPHPNLGRLVSPRNYSRAGDSAELMPVAADNDCFQGLNRDLFVRMLDAIQGVPLAFITVPDVVADAKATGRRFARWRDRVAEAGPVALCAQDGLRNPPWDDFDCLFIGGSTRWKLGEAAHRLVLEARERGKWTHMGRVNTARRMVTAASWGIDSVDGTSVSMYRRTHLPSRLAQAGAPQQLSIEVHA